MKKTILIFCFCVFLATYLAAAESWHVMAQIVPSDNIMLRDAGGLSVSMDRWLYIADTGHHRIVAIDTTGALKAEIGGFGNEHGQFKWPRAVIADRGNAVWVLDYGNRRIEKYSRLLEYQGSFELRIAGDDTPHQIEAFAMSPPGDFYIFDRDDGKLAHFDPLFRLLSESGGSSGSQSVSQISAMTFLPARGLFWWSRGAKNLFTSDPLLSRNMSIPLVEPANALCMAASDSCLMVSCQNSIIGYCNDLKLPNTIVRSDELQSMAIKSFSSMAFASAQELFLLDGSAGIVYRLRKIEE